MSGNNENPGPRLAGWGFYENVLAQVDKSHAALRTTLRPPETGVYGSYRLSLESGVIAAGIAANSPVWEMRWGQSSVIAIIRKLQMQAVVSTTAFASTAADSSFALYRAQGFTTIDATGATLAAFTPAKSQANATRMSSSQFSSDSSSTRTAQGGIGISSTAAMSGGTKTLDANPIHIIVGRILASAAAETIITPEPPPYLIDPSESPVIPPIELSANEGLILVAVAITGTGTWRLKVDVAWDEVDPSRYFGMF